MTYIAKKNKKGMITSGALILFSVIIASMSRIFQSYAMVVNIVSYVILITGLFVAIKFGISFFTYEVDDNNLNIYKTTGARRESVASIDLTTGKGAAKQPKSEQEKNEFTTRFGTTDRRMNFCTNLFANKYVYVTEFNGKNYELLLEIDEIFCQYLNEIVTKKHLSLHED